MSCAALHAATNPISDPLPEPTSSGLSIEISPWITIPASSGGSPKAKINHLKPCPGEDRLFCNDLRGKLWSIAGGNASSASEYLDLDDYFPKFIGSPGLGTGFASFDFHPEFHQPGAPGYGKFYTAHSESADGAAPDFTGPETSSLSQLAVVVEWTLNDPDAAAVTPGNHTRREILRFGFPYHFHGMQEIAFDPTANPGSENYGCLFICVGDGGSIVIDQPDNINRVDSPLGSILRIAPVLAAGYQASEFSISSNGNYYIPSGSQNSNPNVGAPDPTPGDGFPAVEEVYANGFRNPHRISWDSGGSGKMLCGNIGESMVEEIELVTKGSNHGWPAREGAFTFDASHKTNVYPLDAPETGGYSYPVTQYDHDGGRAALIGGFVYHGTGIPYLQGKYVFGDNVTGDLFATSVSEMDTATTTDTGNNPAPARTLGLKFNGVDTTFRNVLGSSRADLRFGIDHSGELYLLSKQNGTIYRIEADSSVTPPQPAGTVADWTPSATFEDNSDTGLSVSIAGSSAQIVNDPLEGPVNRTLRIRSAGSSVLSASLPISPIPDGSRGTLFFRFYLVDQDHNASWGLSERSNPTSASHFRVRLRSANESGELEIREGSSWTDASELATRTWYSAWLDIDNSSGNSNDSLNLYLQGGDYGVPTLVKTGSPFSSGTSSTLQTFFWRMSPGTEMYFDDIHTDPGHFNLTYPHLRDWNAIDNFESIAPLDSWQIPDAENQTLEVITEYSGNHYLRRSAGTQGSANPNAVAAKRLPFDTQVSQTLTVFFRLRMEGGYLRHSFGTTAVKHQNSADYVDDDFAPQLMFDSDPGTGMPHLYDGPAGVEDFYTPPIPDLQDWVWYKVWIVANNRGAASGGQIWKAYIQGGSYDTPFLLGGPVHFRSQVELPITHFLTIASNSSDSDNDAVHIDDIYAYAGENLRDPLEPISQPTSIVRDGNDFTLSYPTNFNHAFQIFESDDLESWQPLGASVEGDATWKELTLPIVHPRRFFHAAEMSRRNFHVSNWFTNFPDAEPPAGITFLESSTWDYEPSRLLLTATAGQTSGMVNRPGGYALMPGDWRNAVFTVEARTLEPASNNTRDVVIIFGYVDETHFYYAHLSSSSNGTTQNAIVKIDGDTATAIQDQSTPPVVLTSSLQTLRVTHQATGAIAVYADDLSTPFMTASDTSFPVGRLGIGSYDDEVEFRSMGINGQKP